MKKIFILIFFISLSFSQNNLCSKLPNIIDGYKQIGKCNYMKMQTNFATGEQAKKDYINNDNKIEVSIITGTFANSILMPYMSITQFENNDTLIKTLNYKGYKTILNYNKIEKRGLIIVILNQKNINIKALLLNFEQLTPNEAIKILNYLNLKEIN